MGLFGPRIFNMSDVCMMCGEEYGDCRCFNNDTRKDKAPLEVQEEMGEA